MEAGTKNHPYITNDDFLVVTLNLRTADKNVAEERHADFISLGKIQVEKLGGPTRQDQYILPTVMVGGKRIAANKLISSIKDHPDVKNDFQMMTGNYFGYMIIPMYLVSQFVLEM